MEQFVQSSGDDGIVIFTLGSLINNVTTEKAEVIASALAQIPQKVSICFCRIHLPVFNSPESLFILFCDFEVIK